MRRSPPPEIAPLSSDRGGERSPRRPCPGLRGRARRWGAAAMAWVCMVASPGLCAAATTKPRSAAVIVEPVGELSLDKADAVAKVAIAVLESSTDMRVESGPSLRASIETQGVSWTACLGDSGCRAAVNASFTLVLWYRLAASDDGYTLTAERLLGMGQASQSWHFDEPMGLTEVIAAVRRVASQALEEAVLLVVQVDEPGGELTVDGHAVPPDAVGLRHITGVAPGARVVRWRTTHNQVIETTVVCRTEQACAVAMSAQRPEPDNRQEWVRGFAWGSLALSVAAAGIGTGFAIYSADIEDELHSHCRGGFCDLPASEVSTLENRGERATLTANILFGLAGAAALAATGLFIDDALHGRSDRGNVSVVRRSGPVLRATEGLSPGGSRWLPDLQGTGAAWRF